MAEKAYITPKVLKWARETARLTREQAAGKIPAGADLRSVLFFTVIDLPKLGYACGQVVQVQSATFYRSTRV